MFEKFSLEDSHIMTPRTEEDEIVDIKSFENIRFDIINEAYEKQSFRNHIPYMKFLKLEYEKYLSKLKH